MTISKEVFKGRAYDVAIGVTNYVQYIRVKGTDLPDTETILTFPLDVGSGHYLKAVLYGDLMRVELWEATGGIVDALEASVVGQRHAASVLTGVLYKTATRVIARWPLPEGLKRIHILDRRNLLRIKTAVEQAEWLSGRISKVVQGDRMALGSSRGSSLRLFDGEGRHVGFLESPIKLTVSDVTRHVTLDSYMDASVTDAVTVLEASPGTYIFRAGRQSNFVDGKMVVKDGEVTVLYGTKLPDIRHRQLVFPLTSLAVNSLHALLEGNAVTGELPTLGDEGDERSATFNYGCTAIPDEDYFTFTEGRVRRAEVLTVASDRYILKVTDGIGDIEYWSIRGTLDVYGLVSNASFEGLKFGAYIVYSENTGHMIQWTLYTEGDTMDMFLYSHSEIMELLLNNEFIRGY